MRFLPTSLLCALSLSATAQSVRLLVQSSPLAGFQYYAGAAVWENLRVGDRLALVREAENPHETNAVRIAWRGLKLGYLPRAENEAVARALDRGECVEERITALTQHKTPWGGCASMYLSSFSHSFPVTAGLARRGRIGLS